MRPAFPYSAAYPAIPPEVADDFAILRYVRLRAHAPIQYMVMIVVVFAAMFIGSPDVPTIVRLGIPAVVIALSLWRLLHWVARSEPTVDPATARRITKFATFYSTAVAAFCSCWAIGSCLTIAGDARAYYALLMVVGSVSALLCVFNIRLAAYLTLIAGMAPVTVLLLISASQADLVAAAVIVAAGVFLTRMVHQQHGQVIELLQLQRQMHDLAHTDCLTGLTNRRGLEAALTQSLAAPDAGGGPALAIIDLDGFKPVNDTYGHATGDMLLREVARRLADIGADNAIVARLGGDEFAALIPPTQVGKARQISDRMLASLVKPIAVDGASLRIGASIGLAIAPHDGATCADLMAAADKTLYRAKAMGRGMPSGGVTLSEMRA